MVDPYTFEYAPSKEEIEKFEYAAYDYIDSNPGRIEQTYLSYVGIYFSETGELSGIYVANSSVEQY